MALISPADTMAEYARVQLKLATELGPGYEGYIPIWTERVICPHSNIKIDALVRTYVTQYTCLLCGMSLREEQ